jgi:hypothetical protein
MRSPSTASHPARELLTVAPFTIEAGMEPDVWGKSREPEHLQASILEIIDLEAAITWLAAIGAFLIFRGSLIL